MATSRPGKSLDALAALDDERASLLRSLTDLQREYDAGDLDEADYLALKDEYTVRTADLLRHRANVEAGVQETVALARRSRAQRPWRRPVGVIATIATALGIGVAVARFAGERVGSQGLTGSVRSAGTARSNEVSALLSKAQQNLSADPFKALRDLNDAVGANADFTALAALNPPAFVKQLVGSASDEARAAVIPTSRPKVS